MIKEFWDKLVGRRKSSTKLSRLEQILSELDRGQGTARQVSDRSGIKLSVVRTNLSTLHRMHLIRATGTKVPTGFSEENVWEVVR
jgi:GTP-sensing pleiotropic transcriptional regulator CodY